MHHKLHFKLINIKLTNNTKYKTGFTSGALLFDDSNAAINSISDELAFINGKENIDDSVLLINSESSKKRIRAEIERRLRIINNPAIISLFKITDETNKKLILFYAACKLYPLLSDFMLEVVLNKWYNMDYELTTDDFQNFIYHKSDNHPELLEITDNTKYKLSQVTLKMLKELGLLKEYKLQKIEFDTQILIEIAKNGDLWFLELIFLNKMEINEILS